jgi:hypothetical protein
MATMVSTVPSLVSPVTCCGHSFQRKRAPEAIAGRLVLLHLGGGNQGGEDDPRPATIDDGVVVVAQVGVTLPARHRRGLRIGRADPEIGGAPIRPTPPGAVGVTRSADPVVALRGLGGKGALGCLR